MHFSDISPQSFVCPLLHITIGLVNKIWSEIIEWINDKLENIEDMEAKERESLSIINTMLINAFHTKDEADKTTSIELKHHKAQCKQIQKELKKILTCFGFKFSNPVSPKLVHRLKH